MPPPHSLGRQIAWLVGLCVLCFGAAYVGGQITAQSVEGWYRTLEKPTWTPPDWLFAPVWLTLYASMALAAWLVWKQCGWPIAARPLLIFVIQLILNVGWSFCFFGLRNPQLAMVEIVVLWLAILFTTVVFWRQSRVAGILLVPYLLWTTFAATLNLSICRLNS